ncbi:MAG: metal-dependent transcriptional regulator, partial [Candidatus Latescibacterota bacterium]|nr:metal-dependent transcriptional regulator [Candidatus Latescibacterota bacterium]
MLSKAVQDYLKVIYKLSRAPEAGAMVSTTLIAERMEVSAASATNMIKKLAELRLLEHRPYQGVELTPSGVKMALEIVRHHRLLELYLRQALGYDWDTVDAEAERLEHAISEDLEDRIDEALGFPTVGAHGEPIPTKDGNIAEPEYSRLADLREGQRACIRQVSDRDPELLRYLDR